MCIGLFVPFGTLCGIKTFRTISIFILKYISIFTIYAHISLFFFLQKIIQYTKKPFLFAKHYNITYSIRPNRIIEIGLEIV